MCVCVCACVLSTHLFDCDVFTGEGVSSGGDQLQVFGGGGALQCEYLMGRAT